MEEPNTNNTDPTVRIADALEKLCRVQIKTLEELREVRLALSSLRTSFNEAHHIY